MNEPTEIITTAEPVVACDGGGGPLGHPRVYLNLETAGVSECPYCGRRYILDQAAARAPAH